MFSLLSRLNASLNLTTFLWSRFLRALTSRNAIFLMMGLLSDSLNFLMATTCR